MPSITRKAPSRDARRRLVEEKVYEALDRLLAEGESYIELSVQRILDTAGVARSTFYAHFTDKSHLLRCFAERLQSEVFEVGNAWTETDNNVPGLVEVFEKSLAMYRAQKPMFTALIETASYDPAVRSFFTSSMEGFGERVAEHLRQRQEAGLTDPELDPVAAARIIVVGGAQAIADHIQHTESSQDASFARELARTWWAGCYSRPSSSDLKNA